MTSESRSIQVFNNVLRTACALPGAHVDRTQYLKAEFGREFSEGIVETAIMASPAKAGIPARVIRAHARSCVRWHRAGTSCGSFVSGLPGGWWIVATVPADLSHFFWHVVVVTQKLAYLHGWPQLFEKDTYIDDETCYRIALFAGVMFGSDQAATGLKLLSSRLQKEVAKRLPQKALTKYGLYKVAKEVAKWIGIRLTKQTFTRFVVRAIPVASGFLAGGISWCAFSKMSKRLEQHLAKLDLHNGADSCPVPAF